jgi:hypothetical protein
MAEYPDVHRLASAVAHRIVASARSAPLTAAGAKGNSPALLDRLASAVGQRLAARTVTNIDQLASAVAHRLAASEPAAPLVQSVVAHYGSPYSSPELDQLVDNKAVELSTRKG